MAGREGLVDTAVKTAETGYMQVTVSGVGGLSALQKEGISYMYVEVRGVGAVHTLGMCLCV